MSLELGDALIAMTFIQLMGIIIIFAMRDRTWFKKEQWRQSKKNADKILDIKLGSLRKELGLKKTGKISSDVESTGIADTIAKGIGSYISESDEGGGGIISEFLESNPEVVQNFIQGFLKGKEGKNPEDFWNN